MCYETEIWLLDVQYYSSEVCLNEEDIMFVVSSLTSCCLPMRPNKPNVALLALPRPIYAKHGWTNVPSVTTLGVLLRIDEDDGGVREHGYSWPSLQ